MIGFIIGLFIGGVLGVVTMAILRLWWAQPSPSVLL